MKQSLRIGLILLFASLALSPLNAQPKKLTDVQIKTLDSLALQDVPPKAPGIATAIISQGIVIYEKVGGYADFTDSSFITNKTRFNIASNGKQFTALAILKLISEKKLSLKTDIRKYLPELYSTVQKPITIAHLLGQTSGIRDVYDLWSLKGITWWENRFEQKDALALLQKQTDLNGEPGAEYRYSNSNYILLAIIVEKVSGKSFRAYTDELFKSLNMPNTHFENNSRAIQGPIARAYFNFNKWITYEWQWNIYGDGNLFTTLDDQIQWEKIIHGKIKSGLSKKLIEISQQLDSAFGSKIYGYGLEFGKYKSIPYQFHEGATGAWKATVLRFPNQLTFITLTNTGKSIPSMQTRQMADVVLGLAGAPISYLTKPEKAGAEIKESEIEGVYLTENDFYFKFENRNGKLFLIRDGRNDVELEREADNIFHQKYDPAFKQEFIVNGKGEMTVTAYYISHSPYTLTRKEAEWKGFSPNSIDGIYFSAELEQTIKIEADSTNSVALKLGENTYKGFFVNPSKLLIGGYQITIGEKNGLKAVYLSGDRVKKIVFSEQK